MRTLVKNDFRLQSLSCGYAGGLAALFEDAIVRHSLQQEYEMYSLKEFYTYTWQQRSEEAIEKHDLQQPYETNSLEAFYLRADDFSNEERTQLHNALAGTENENAQLRLHASAATLLWAKNSVHICKELDVTLNELGLLCKAQVREPSAAQWIKDQSAIRSQVKERGFGQIKRKSSIMVDATGMLGEDRHLLAAHNLSGMTSIKASMQFHRQQAKALTL